MHQHISMLNFKPCRRLSFSSRVTSKVFTIVTIGIGDCIHISNALALLVVLGSTSLIIVVYFTQIT